MNKQMTIHDIAREAGVSPSTVSRVLSGRAAVAEEKRAAVMAVITHYNYRPSTLAQSLKSGRTGAIGVMTQFIGSVFYAHLLSGIEEGLSETGYHPLFASSNWQIDQEIAALEMLTARRVDGLIVLGGLCPDDYLREVAQRMPLIVVGRQVAGLENQSLKIDDFQGAYEATRFLINLGHQRIVHITGNLKHHDAIERREGYLKALHEFGITPDPNLIIEGEYSQASGVLAVQSLISRMVRFSAIFAANDDSACGARLALFRNGIRVPDDVSLVGFDDLPSSAYATPPLTSIRQPMIEMGRIAGRAVVQLLNDQPADLPVIHSELIVRESAAMRR